MLLSETKQLPVVLRAWCPVPYRNKPIVFSLAGYHFVKEASSPLTFQRACLFVLSFKKSWRLCVLSYFNQELTFMLWLRSGSGLWQTQSHRKQNNAKICFRTTWNQERVPKNKLLCQMARSSAGTSFKRPLAMSSCDHFGKSETQTTCCSWLRCSSFACWRSRLLADCFLPLNMF